MKKFIGLLLGLVVAFTTYHLLLTTSGLSAAGLRLGMTGAVKEKVKELDKKVREKKAAEEKGGIIGNVSGTAAKGKPIASATVSIKDANGKAKSTTTGTDGKFNVDVTELTSPLLLKVTEGTVTYFSIANATGTCNIHPFTDLVVRTYFKSSKGISDMNTTFESNYASLGTLPTKETIDTIKSVVATVVSSILERNGIDPISYDMFTTPFNANSTGFDKALEQTQITFGSGYDYVVIKDTTTNIVISTVTPTANDTTAPAVPTNLVATGISGTSVKLSWTASPGTDIAGYVIYRDGVKIAGVSYTTYLDVGLTAGTQYSYTIEAYDWAGNKSAKTTAVTATTPSEFAITSTGKYDGIPATAFDGTNYLMVFGVRDLTNVPYNLKAQFVLGSGQPGNIISFDVLGSSVHGSALDVANIAYGSNKYLIVFRSTETYGNNSGNLYGIFVTPAGVKSSSFLISTAPSEGRPGVASDGTNYLVVWCDFRNTCNNWDVYGRLVSQYGSLIGSEIAITTAPYRQQGTATVSSYGDGKYFLTWHDARRNIIGSDTGTDVYGRFVSTDGSLGSEILIDDTDFPSNRPSIAAFDNVNKKYFVAYHDQTEVYSSSSLWKCYGRFVDMNGNVSPKFTISNRPLDQFVPVPCFDGTKYFVTWADGYGTMDVTTKARFFDTNGNKLGNEITLLTKKGSENFVWAWPFFGGSKYFLSIIRANLEIQGNDWIFSNGDIYGIFINP